jgi:hypothetical protein
VYAVDSLDSLLELTNVPPEAGAPCPAVFAEDHQLVLSYWTHDTRPNAPTTTPLAVIQFRQPYFHLFGPPNDEAIEGIRFRTGGSVRMESSEWFARLLSGTWNR